MARFIKLENGDLVLPANGKKQDPPAGYEANPQNPYHFIYIFEPCIYREEFFRPTPCNKLRAFQRCKLKSIDITSSSDCEGCKERKEA